MCEKETYQLNHQGRSGDDALLDEEVLESGTDRLAVGLLLLLVPAREPTGNLAGARFIR